MEKEKIRIFQAQLKVVTDLDAAFAKAEEYCRQATDAGADILCLPEMWCCPYEASHFPEYAQPDGGEISSRSAELAAKYGLILSAGSVPESDGEGRIFNSAYVFGRNGERLAKHRKMHLFDIDVKGGQRFMESETLSAGKDVTLFEADGVRMGLMICYDVRFPELTRLMALGGAKLVLCPAAFNMTTGPRHWELCHRSEAMYNQLFVVATSPCLDVENSYHAWGHSIAVDPWGMVIAQLDEKEGVQITELDLRAVDEAREQIPLLRQRRTDVYRLEEL
ncbi:MAG: carbon-nitrogen hydrolase family protein [Firmicutes bacterium]|nr:carbon-nitrogen hydrolase family protein [Bacillota bacterium]